MGIPVDEPAFVFGDNQSVLCKTTVPGSTLKKKQYVLAYHFVREGVARDEWRTAYVNTDENLADLLTKPLSGPKRIKFVRMATILGLRTSSGARFIGTHDTEKISFSF